MRHLTDQQLEEILQGTAPESAHLEECELCRGRLSEFRALQDRLRVAFTSVHADQKLSERVRSRLNHASAGSSTVQPEGKKAPSQVYRLFWRAAAAAAVLLLIPKPNWSKSISTAFRPTRSYTLMLIPRSWRSTSRAN
jgi:hypothetical protein